MKVTSLHFSVSLRICVSLLFCVSLRIYVSLLAVFVSPLTSFLCLTSFEYPFIAYTYFAALSREKLGETGACDAAVITLSR